MDKSEITVLLVEDNSIAQTVGAALITKAGYKVEVAHSGTEALELLAKNKYEIVFMDVGLPDISGFAITESVRAKEGPNKGTQIVALTAHVEDEYHNQAEWFGMTSFMEKPLTEKKLESVMNTLLNQQVAPSVTNRLRL